MKRKLHLWSARESVAILLRRAWPLQPSPAKWRSTWSTSRHSHSPAKYWTCGTHIGSARRDKSPNLAGTGAVKTNARRQSAGERRASSGPAVREGAARQCLGRGTVTGRGQTMHPA
eukprot:1324524-Pyramimonas_sp.AAC.1